MRVRVRVIVFGLGLLGLGVRDLGIEVRVSG